MLRQKQTHAGVEIQMLQYQISGLQIQMANVPSWLTKLFVRISIILASTSSPGTLPSQTITNPRQQVNAITTRSVQNPNLANAAHVPPPGKEDSFFMEIPKPKAKKTINVEIQDLNSPNPNSNQSRLPYPRTAKSLIDLYEEKLTLRVGKDELVYYAEKSEKNKEKNFVHAISIIDFSKDDPFSGSTTNTFPPSSFPEKTSDNLEKFTNELAPLDSLPPGNDDSALKKDLHVVENFQVYSNPLFKFNDSFKSSKVNPLFEENDKDVEIKRRKKIICLLETFINKKPKPLPQAVKEIKEKEDAVSSDVPIIPFVMVLVKITFDNPINFNDHFSKPKDLKKDLPISFDSTTDTSILPHPLLDFDSPFTTELSASVILNSLVKRDHKTLLVFKEPSFLLPPPEPPDECLKDVVLNEDFYQNQKTFPLNVEDVNSFAFIIFQFFTYTKESPLIFSFRRFSQQIFEVSRVQLIYPVLLEFLILCVKLVWVDPYPFIIID
ncbi:hypothetical protein Tco_1531584 [Tanacetum coccineum]